MLDEYVNKKVKFFFENYKSKIYKDRHTFIYGGDADLYAYYLKKGHVRQYTLLNDGTELTFHIFHPNSFFPLMWILGDIENRYYYEALGNVELYYAPREDVKSFINENNDVLSHLTSSLLVGINKLLGRIEQLVSYSAYERTISAILFLARHFGEESPDGVRINLKVRHIDIANFAGITRETTSRTLDQLRGSGLIDYKGKNFFIKDIKSLKKVLNLEHANLKDII